MSESGNNSQQSAESLMSKKLYEICNSDSLSKEGLQEIIEIHDLTPHNNHHVSDYEFFLRACINKRVTEGIIKCLLEYFPEAISATNYLGQTPLNCACNNIHVTLNIIQLLVDAAPHSVSHADNTGWTPLHSLCSKKILDEAAALEIMKLLIEKCPEAVRHADIQGYLPIHYIASRNNVTPNIVQLLIDAAPESVHSVDEDGYTPLHLLCMHEKLDETAALGILKLLLEKQPETIRHADNDGDLPIHLALGASKSPEFCRMLIESYPGSERMTDGNGVLPLHYACAYNTLATVEYLYKLHPDAINHTTRGGYPIHTAIFGVIKKTKSFSPSDSVDIVKFLLECDPNVKLQKVLVAGLSPLHYACHLDYNDSNIEAGIEVIKAIYDAHPEAIEDNIIASNIHEYHEQVQAFINNELVYARQAKDHPMMITPDRNGQLPLHTALQNNATLGSIKLLVKGNPPAVQSPDSSGLIPLHVAFVHHDSVNVVHYLLGLDTSTLDAIDRKGDTALHYACRGARHEIIVMLLERYDAVSVSKRNANGKLPVDLLWESDEVLDRDSVEYTESVFRLLAAYPETLTYVDMKQQGTSDRCSTQNGKKRKLHPV